MNYFKFYNFLFRYQKNYRFLRFESQNQIFSFKLESSSNWS